MEKKEIRQMAETIKGNLERKAEAFAEENGNDNKTVSVSVSHFHNKADEFFTLHFTLLIGCEVADYARQLLIGSYTKQEDIDRFMEEVNKVLK